MIKFRLMFDKDVETTWLNDMAAQGYAMKSFFAGFYTFEKCEPGEYIYQVDFGDKFGDVTEDYREFMSEAGVEIVQTWGYWVILRKLANDGDFSLYTDVDSSIEHYKKIRKLFKIVGIFETLLMIFEFIMYGVTESSVSLSCALIISVFVAVFLRAIYKTNVKLDKLMEKKTGLPTNVARRPVSPLLSVGLLFNCIGIISRDGISEGITICIEIAAIVFMFLGIVTMVKRRSQE